MESSIRSIQKRDRQLMKKIQPKIAWSRPDRCWVGSAPPLVGPCCHGESKGEVAAYLAEIIRDLACDLAPHANPRPGATMAMGGAKLPPGKRLARMMRDGLINKDGSLSRRPRPRKAIGELMLEDAVRWANLVLAREKPSKKSPRS
jgi:hypothetical protein